MDLLQRLSRAMFGEDNQAKPAPQRRAAPARMAPRPQMLQVPQLPQSAPRQPKTAQGFRMYEDNSFTGNPRQFMAQNPGYTFYEDQTFSPPQPKVRTQREISMSPFKMYEDGSFEGNPQQFISQNPGYRFYEDNTFSSPR